MPPSRSATAAFLILSALFSGTPSGPTGVAAAADSDGPSASRLRASADAAMVSGDNRKAAKLLAQATRVEPDNEQNFYKLFRVHLRMKKHRSAVKDLRRAVELKPDFGSALLQLGKLETKMGACGDAAEHLLRLSRCEQNACAKARAKMGDALARAQQCDALMRRAASREHDHEFLVDAMGEVVELAPLSHDLHLRRARANLELNRLHNALSDAGRALKLHKESVDALLVRARAYFRLTELDMALRHLREGLRLDPENRPLKALYRTVKTVKKSSERARAAMESRDWAGAVAHAEKAVAQTPRGHANNGRLKALAAKAHLELGQVEEARAAADAAAKILGTANGGVEPAERAEALCARADAEVRLEQYAQATRTADEAIKADPSSQSAKKCKQRAQAALKQSREKNYYKILGVKRDASLRQIKKAYRGLALKWHPDKHEGEAAKAEAQKEFQDVAEAYEILTDEELREKYDRGEDVLQNQGNGGQRQHGFPFGMFNNMGGGTHHFHFSHR
jgi:DnaJ family protein C protein 3